MSAKTVTLRKAKYGWGGDLFGTYSVTSLGDGLVAYQRIYFGTEPWKKKKRLTYYGRVVSITEDEIIFEKVTLAELKKASHRKPLRQRPAPLTGQDRPT